MSYGKIADMPSSFALSSPCRMLQTTFHHHTPTINGHFEKKREGNGNFYSIQSCHCMAFSPTNFAKLFVILFITITALCSSSVSSHAFLYVWNRNIERLEHYHHHFRQRHVHCLDARQVNTGHANSTKHVPRDANRTGVQIVHSIYVGMQIAQIVQEGKVGLLESKVHSFYYCSSYSYKYKFL